MTLTELLEKLERVALLCNTHSIPIDECSVRIFGEAGVPHRLEIRYESEDGLTQISVKLQ